MRTLQFLAITSAVMLICAPGANAEYAGTAPATNVASLRLYEGMSFLKARAQIIKAGWSPMRMHVNDHYEYDGAERRLAERNFLEVDACSVDRGALCALYYAKGNACLRIDTIGEHVESMRVTRWTEECPEGQHASIETNRK